MAIPTSTDLKVMDIAYLGSPFIDVPAKSISLVTMDITYLGMPFVRNPYPSGGPAISMPLIMQQYNHFDGGPIL